MAEALQTVVAILFAGVACLIHAIFPPLFETTASDILKNVVRRNTNRVLKDADHILIRYNTKNEGGPLVWRVIINGEEFPASHVEITGRTYGEESLADGSVKMNIACDGRVQWHGTVALITTRLVAQ